MRDKEFEKRKKTIEDLKQKLDDIKQKTDEYSSKNKKTNVTDETIMMPRAHKNDSKELYKKSYSSKEDMFEEDEIKNKNKKYKEKEKLKIEEEKSDLSKEDQIKNRRKERLREKNQRKENLKKRQKEDKKILEKKQEEEIKKGKKIPFKNLTGKQKALRIFRNIFLCLIFLMIIGAGLVLGYLYGLFGNDRTLDKSILEGAQETTIVYNKEGKEVARLSDDERRTVIKLNEMGEYIPKAYIAIEDQRFNEHPGIDFKRTIGAVFNYVVRKRSEYGGSTITQQLIKNLTDDKEKSAMRKVRELSRALQLEQKLSKDEILELYLNLIFVGGENVYGISLASDYYFAKEAKDLSLEEAAFLAGINHSPAKYNPYIEKGFRLDDNGKEVVDNKEAYDKYVDMQEKIKIRTNTVLDKMFELNKISKEEYDKAKEAVKNGLKFKKGNLAYSTTEYSHLTDAAIEEAIDALAKKRKIDKNAAKVLIVRGGYHIYTTEDSKIQNQVEEAMRTKAHTIYSVEHKDEEGNPYKSQAVVTILDHKTGQIIAAVGGLEDQVKMKRGDWNRVTRTVRQPGSAIKPIVVTAPGLESGKFTLGNTFDDTPYEKNGWRPNNFSQTFSGRTTIRRALVKSLNIPQIRQLELITPKYAADFLRRMEFNVHPNDDNNLAIALGGFTNGFTTINMASAYAMIANDGEYISPTFLLKVENRNGDVVYKPEQKRERMMSKENAYLLKNVLKDSTNPGEIAAKGVVPGFDVAAKTGTTDNFKDSYYCTFTNLYTAAAWYGFDKAESFFNIRSGYYNPSMDILSGIFKTIHQGKEGSAFVKPENIITERVLIYEYRKAPEGLTQGTFTELFIKGTEPKETSSDYVSVKVCKKSGKLASSDCAEEDVEVKVFKKGEEPKEYCTECKNKKTEQSDKINKEIQKVINVYNSLGNISGYGLDAKSTLLNAKTIYEALSPDAKAKISPGITSKYNEIVQKLKTLNEDVQQNAANEVMNKINAIPANITKANINIAKTAVSAARLEYNKLTPAAKRLVTNYASLVAAEGKIKTVEAE